MWKAPRTEELVYDCTHLLDWGAVDIAGMEPPGKGMMEAGL
jgi:hypothetical protein